MDMDLLIEKVSTLKSFIPNNWSSVTILKNSVFKQKRASLMLFVFTLHRIKDNVIMNDLGEVTDLAIFLFFISSIFS